MTETDKKEKPHEHVYYPYRIYELGNFNYVVVLLGCECGETEWDIGDRVDNNE
jgi:hypothetical protein